MAAAREESDVEEPEHDGGGAIESPTPPATTPDDATDRRFRRHLLAQLFFLCLALLAFLLSVVLREQPGIAALLRGLNIGFGIAAVVCAVRRRRLPRHRREAPQQRIRSKRR
jgi:hypothetical protein